MTVASTVSSVSYAGNGSTPVFAVPFYFLKDTDLIVNLVASDGTPTTQTITTHYTVTGAGNPAGGSVTMITPPASGQTLQIVRNPSILQETDYVENDPFPAETHERALDLLTMISQRLAFRIGRALRVSDADPVASAALELPAKANRAGKVLAFDDNGTPVAAASVGSQLLTSDVIASLLTGAMIEALLTGDMIEPLLTAEMIEPLLPPSGGGDLYPQTAAELAAGITPTDTDYEPGNVLRYGAVADDTSESGTAAGGATDNATAFNTAWAAIKATGGRITAPAGKYYLNATWLLDVDLTAPRDYAIDAYGATIRSGASVTGFAVQIYKGYNFSGVKIRGLHINHRNNATAAGAVQLKGASNAYLKDIVVELYSNAATWTGFELAPYTLGDGNTHCFWCVLDQCSTRKRSGSDGGSGVYSYCGINLKGQANATVIRNCRIASVTHGIRMETDGSVQGFANGVVIKDCAIEGVTNGWTLNTASPATIMPTGLKIKDCRFESMTTCFNVTGAAISDHSHPPILRDNYVSVGSVTNYLVNTNNQRFRIDEPSYYGATAMDNKVGGPNNYRVYCEGVGKNFRISNESDKSNYAGAHLILGGYHLWINDPDGGTGKLRMKWGVPTTDTDGTVVGTQT